MRRSTARAAALALVLLVIPAHRARGQKVLGPGDDALVLPRGVFRVRVLQQQTRFDQRYGSGTPGYAEGALEPLAVDFNLDTIGVAQFRNLAPVEAGLRSLTGIPDLRLSLGRTVVTSSATVTATPVVIEGGLTSRLSLGLTIPFVHTRNDIFFAVNPGGSEGNIGFNPALTTAAAASQNAALVQQLLNAAAALEGNVGQPAGGCGTQASNACQLVNSTRSLAGGIAQIYGTESGAGFRGSPFVPIVGTEAQATLEARIAALKAQYPSAIGSTVTIAGPFASPSRLTTADAQRILTDPAFGIDGEPLRTTETTRIGDVELGAKYLVLDSFRGDAHARYVASGFNWRSAVTGLVRLGTGRQDRPENFVDIGTGNGQTDLELRSATDLLWGSHLWSSFIVRLGMQLPDQETVRIADRPNQKLVAAWRQVSVARDLGDYVELEASPKLALNDYVQLGAQWLYRRKGKDRYTGRFEVDTAVAGYSDPASPVPGKIVIDASTLDLETATTEQRLGGGIAFSTLAAYDKGKFAVPIELTFLHWQTVRGSGGNQPRFFTDQLQLRVYTRLFGGNQVR